MRTLSRIALVLLILVSMSTMSAAQTASTSSPPDLTALSLEDLMNLNVTSVSRKAQRLSGTAAAVFVLTQEDIRRSGATSIPDLLRMVPGVNVAQISASAWAVSIRGFNGQFSNKLLVMIDGRSIYSSLFSGVYWESHNPLMEDIDRIEVIRGPGGTMWGANAVNGVINIITKSADQTQHNLLSAGTGGEQKEFGSLRFTGKMGKYGNYRVSARQFALNGSIRDPMLPRGADAWDMQNANFRGDWTPNKTDSISLEAGAYRGNVGQVVFDDAMQPTASKFAESGLNLRGRWARTQVDGSGSSLQVYYDYNEFQAAVLSESHTVMDVDYQSCIILSDKHDFMWGAGYRRTSDDTKAGTTVSLNPPARTDNLMTAFVQDSVALRDTLNLTVGTKVEHNDYSGLEIQPSVRLAWTPDSRHTYWASISRAVRTPTRSEANGVVDAGSEPGDGYTVLYKIFGNPEFQSEIVVAHELGFRLQPTKKLSLDVAGFYNVYADLRSLQIGDPYPMQIGDQTYMIVPINVVNMLNGNTVGYEASAVWDAANNCRLRFGYSRLKYDLQYEPGSNDPVGLSLDASSNTPPASGLSWPAWTCRTTSNLTLRCIAPAGCSV